MKAVIQAACGERPDDAHIPQGAAIRFIPAGEESSGASRVWTKFLKIPGIVKAECLKTIGDRIPPLTSSLDRAGYVIAQADGPEQAVSLCDQAMKKNQVYCEGGRLTCTSVI